MNTSGGCDPDVKRVDTPHRRCLCRVYVCGAQRRASEFLSAELRAIGGRLTAGWQLAGRAPSKVSVRALAAGTGRLNYRRVRYFSLRADVIGGGER